MGKKRRIEYEGAIYHVIQRGNNQEFIFEHDGEKRYLIKRLADYKESMGFRLFGYVIMGNHYHLILQTLDEPLHKIMHGINNSYGKFYNTIRDRTGHVFGGRYKAILVQDEGYILSLLRYVHQNPVRAGICSYAGEYPWSSDVFYRRNRGGLVDIDLILDILSGNRARALARYKEFIEVEETADYSSVDIIGGDDFIQAVNSRLEGPRKSLDEILLDTGVSAGDYELIKSGSRKRRLAPYKAAYARESLQHNYSLEQIARHINLSKTAVSRLLHGQ